MTIRNVLPQRRYGETFELTHGKHNTAFQITTGHYPDGTIGEVFISGAKAGTDLEAVARDGAVLMSLALQHGCTIETMRHAITREQDGKPSTIVGAVIDKLTELVK